MLRKHAILLQLSVSMLSAMKRGRTNRAEHSTNGHFFSKAEKKISNTLNLIYRADNFDIIV
jgi:hypothetical protein